MGITPLSAAWLAKLHQAGLFKNLTSVIDFGGPQSMDYSVNEWSRYAEGYIQDPEKRDSFIKHVTAVKSGKQSMQVSCLYETYGLGEYSAIDFMDPMANFKHDFNFEYRPGQLFDVVTNFGTSEHIFNTGEAFRTIHRLTKPGGLMIHVTPTYGSYYHGFFNTHSILFESMAHFNNYVIEDLSYVYDIFSENEKFIKQWKIKLESIKGTPLKNQNLKFFWHYFKSVVAMNERPMSMIKAVLRKVDEYDFVYPQQLNKYPG
ncbi:MAG: hypothetical protein CMQ40_01060 [Gammaproteobacteria bacterium]|nr:hypothetical protein [Gammaproteobacteria bacterium]